jgi:hydrogenase/urease accessory protein HupE
MKRYLLCLLALLFCLPCFAHDPRYSSITFRWDTLTGLRLSVVVPAGREKDVTTRLKLHVGHKAVSPVLTGLLPDTNNRTVLVDYALPGVPPESLTLSERLFPEDPESRTVVLLYVGNQLLREEVLDTVHPHFAWSAQSARTSPRETVQRFVREGVGHIFSGQDHVLFVVALLLLGGTLKQLLKIVTAFTLAHSVTLCLAATQTLTLSPALVEPLIALSIVAVGVENLLTKPGERDTRAALALGFGLIHGFGFAGALTEVGLPKDALGLALGAFNIGVELGQLTLVLTIAPLLALLKTRRPAAARRATWAGSVVVILLGVLWFLQRIG